MENFDVVIVGGGISGLTVASELCRLAHCRVLLLEQGDTYQDRLASDSPDLLVGLGGAGTIGGGKLCYPPASGAIWEKTAIQYSHAFYPRLERYIPSHTSAPEYSATKLEKNCDFKNRYYEKRYVSKLLLRHDMERLIQELIQTVSRQAVIQTRCRFTEYCGYGDKKLVTYTARDGFHQVLTRFLVLACGRSFARELSQLLPAGTVTQHPADLGIRLVFPRRSNGGFYRAGQDVKLKAVYGDVSVRTFCVCSGGELAKAQYYGNAYYDGHFGDCLTSEVNLGILARSPRCVGIEAAVHYLAAYQDMVGQDITLDQFLHCWKSIPKMEEHRALFSAIARFSQSLLEAGRLGANADEIRVAMPSADRFNSLVRTDEDFCTTDSSIWVVGDAAGVSRGFVQSCWSGCCAASGLAAELLSGKERVIQWG